MIVVDENITEDQCRQLTKWRIRFRRIGRDLGHLGMKDDQHIIPLLHDLDRPTLIASDLGFFQGRLCHRSYSLACFDVGARATATFIRRFLRHPDFRTRKKKGMGTVVLVGPLDLRVWRVNAEAEEIIAWAV